MSATNILPRGRRRRIVNGVVVSVLAAVAGGMVVVHSASPAWGIVVFVLAFLAALLLLQAREGT
jgi:hypothetical protein